MKFFVTAAALALLTSTAFAQSSTSPATQNSQAMPNAQSSADQNSPTNGSPQDFAAAERIKQTLEHEGFTDVKVVARSFVVQGKSPDGDPVVMTIGPHGMSVFEAMNATGSGETTGSSGNSSTGTTGNSMPASPSTNSNSRMQK
jgi:hypothetical protein